MANFLLVHVTRADWTNQRLAASDAKREHSEEVPALAVGADRPEPVLSVRVRRIGDHPNQLPKHRLDVGDLDAMRTAFFEIAAIPVEVGRSIF